MYGAHCLSLGWAEIAGKDDEGQEKLPGWALQDWTMKDNS